MDRVGSGQEVFESPGRVGSGLVKKFSNLAGRVASGRAGLGQEVLNLTGRIGSGEGVTSAAIYRNLATF